VRSCAANQPRRSLVRSVSGARKSGLGTRGSALAWIKKRVQSPALPASIQARRGKSRSTPFSVCGTHGHERAQKPLSNKAHSLFSLRSFVANQLPDQREKILATKKHKNHITITFSLRSSAPSANDHGSPCTLVWPINPVDRLFVAYLEHENPAWEREAPHSHGLKSGYRAPRSLLAFQSRRGKSRSTPFSACRNHGHERAQKTHKNNILSAFICSICG